MKGLTEGYYFRKKHLTNRHRFYDSMSEREEEEEGGCVWEEKYGRDRDEGREAKNVER